MPPAPRPAAELDRIWAMLAAAVNDRASPLRTPVVATADAGVADARVMVLRGVDRAAAVLTFFTDVRAGKIAALAASPHFAVVAWDPGTRRQLRLRGTATVATGGAAVDAAWAGVPVAGRRAYRTVAAPGTPLPTPAFDEGGDGRANFAVLTVALDHIESLELAYPRHVRVAFVARAGVWSGRWLVP